jgi:hypothetical protein|tara:strand:- start:380 stop:532 length:153 start_codon:yes stop_codon:yes gene_type:complete
MTAVAEKVNQKAICIQCDVSPTIMRDYYARDATVYLFKDDLLKVVDIQSP